MAGEGKLDLWGVDAQSPGEQVVDEDGLAEFQLRRDPLPVRLRHLLSLEEDAERVAPLTVLVDEDAKDVQGGHIVDLRSIDYLGPR